MSANPAAYERDWRRLTRSYRILTNGLLAASRPQLARRSNPEAGYEPLTLIANVVLTNSTV